MYIPPDKKHWQGRIDEEDGSLGKRWHQRIQLIDLSQLELPKLPTEETGVVILGFACDEGVRRNKGRTGAKEGPYALRNACTNLADHLPESCILYDGGTVFCAENRLEDAQKELSKMIQKIAEANYFPLVFGGGHEVALPHFTGLFNGLRYSKVLGIINIDAHFDLRIPTRGSTSGTPFSEIANFCQKHASQFNYFCIGIQPAYNTKALFQRADDLGASYLLSDELDSKLSNQQITMINAFIEKCDLIYLTICLDVFDAAFAPGVSAPSANGLLPSLAADTIRLISTSGKLASANVAELNPALDHDSRTAKLAARFAYDIISEPVSKGKSSV